MKFQKARHSTDGLKDDEKLQWTLEFGVAFNKGKQGTLQEATLEAAVVWGLDTIVIDFENRRFQPGFVVLEAMIANHDQRSIIIIADSILCHAPLSSQR